ncbi:MAG: pilus assembly protein PilZ [Betaproteobacteria bacterium]|jgi:type IV pilus assembly protein PilZ|nr:pilus assembly protein PilZ [Betaproteobacteria bacterium]
MNDTAHDPAIARPGVFSLVIRSKAALYAAWIPLLRGGGIFVPSVRDHRLGEDVLVLLSLLDDSVKIPIHGHVAWVNPPHAASNRPQGVGVQLPDTEPCRELRKRVEGLLAGALQSSRPTHTI